MTEEPEQRLRRMRAEIDETFHRCKCAVVGTVVTAVLTESPLLIGMGAIATGGLCGVAIYKDLFVFRKEFKKDQ